MATPVSGILRDSRVGNERNFRAEPGRDITRPHAGAEHDRFGPFRPASLITVSTRYVEGYRDAAVIAISQLREIHIDGQLELIDAANWYPRVIRKDYTVGVTISEGGLDDPDQKFLETYACAEGNYTGYYNAETDRLIDRHRWKLIRRSRASWYGKSNADWLRTHPDWYCCIRGLRRACSRGSEG